MTDSPTAYESFDRWWRTEFLLSKPRPTYLVMSKSELDEYYRVIESEKGYGDATPPPSQNPEGDDASDDVPRPLG